MTELILILALSFSPLNTLWWAEDSVSPQMAAGLQQNLLAHYRFEEGAGLDKTNAANPGFYTLEEHNNPGTNMVGVITNAFSMFEIVPPVNDILFFPFNSAWNFTNQNFSIAFWFFPRRAGSSSPVFGLQGQAVGFDVYQWVIRFDSSRRLLLRTRYGPGVLEYQDINSLVIIPTNNWHFAVCNFYASGSVDWIINNGVPISTTGVQPLYNNTESGFTVGPKTNGAERVDFGLDSLSIWTNKILSLDEINFLYNSASGKDLNEFNQSP